jgi:single-strand DNA-binding protein
MKNTNHCVLHGWLGKDPEVRFRNSGGATVLFSLCTNDDYHNGTEWVEVKEWHDCVVVGNAAEQYAEKYQQGDEVIVQGRVKPRFYEKNGQKVKADRKRSAARRCFRRAQGRTAQAVSSWKR